MQEAELVEGCKKYNQVAQKLVYKKYYPLFLRICTRYILDKEEAKDIVQDAFLKIFFNIGKFKSEGSFEGWMKRIVINDTLTFIKKKAKNKTESFSEDHSKEDFMDETEEEGMNYIFTEEELLAAIHSLPDHLRTVFNLACLEDYSHKEIASLLSISEENSRARLLNARQKLKKILEPQKKLKGFKNER